MDPPADTTCTNPAASRSRSSGRPSRRSTAGSAMGWPVPLLSLTVGAAPPRSPRTTPRRPGAPAAARPRGRLEAHRRGLRRSVARRPGHVGPRRAVVAAGGPRHPERCARTPRRCAAWWPRTTAACAATPATATTQSFGAGLRPGHGAGARGARRRQRRAGHLYRYLFDLDLMGSTELWNVARRRPGAALARPTGARPSRGSVTPCTSGWSTSTRR